MVTGSLQEKNGIYQAVLTFKDENGKTKHKWISTRISTSGHNKRAAQRRLNELIEEYSNVPLAVCEEEKEVESKSKGHNFIEYANSWLVSAEFTYDPVTYQGYSTAAKKHILPFFEERYPKKMIEEIGPDIVQEFSDNLSKCGNLKTGGGLCGKSVRNYLTVLSQIFEDAIRKRIIVKGDNPVAMIKKPKKNKFKPSFYAESQMSVLFDRIKEEPLGPMIIVTSTFGLRRSELLGLKWDSLDFENKRVTIQHVVSRFNTIVEKDDTKTEESNRTYPMPPKLEMIFREAKEAERRNRSLFGDDYIQNDYVFKWDNGKPYSPDYVTHKFKKILKKYNLPEIRFHDLRHSCASIMIEMGCNLKDVQTWLGHADIQTTGNVYGHLTNDHLKNIGDELSKRLF